MFAGGPLKVIPQKYKLTNDFLKTLSNFSLPCVVSNNTIKNIGHHARERDVMDESYPIYHCTSINYACAYFIGSHCILR